MKTPIGYYGGKQRLIPEILPLLPPHEQYVECFCGGAAVFFAKQPAENECINDYDERLTNYYWQMKTNFTELQTLIRATLHSEVHYDKAELILEDKTQTPIMRAWAYWVRTQMAFSYILGGGFAFGQGKQWKRNSANKRERFTELYEKRMERCEIFNRDAVDLIEMKDGEGTFFYCDPPYVSSDQGGYKGYTKEHFVKLLDTLSKIKGRFLLSSYPEPELLEYREKFGWNTKDIKQIVSVTGNKGEVKYKTECLTWNYPAPNQQAGLFDEEISDKEEGEQPEIHAEEEGEPVEVVAQKNEPIFTEEELNEGKEL